MDNQDWILKQMELLGQGFGMLMKKEFSSIDLGEIKDENGKSFSVREIITNYMMERQYEKAFHVVNSLKYKFSVYDFEVVSDWFISTLKLESKVGVAGIDQLKISEYSERLKDLL
ncbi:hypothetical protein [Enterococcus sp. RIT-PI-f]|uniref:hypothetical protein n=1 Tax=Enterococcus sp. RIT-PI-f TaxID=1690244 RepID=UPI0006B8F321|nr:hypothetical protein [Enterococcus sp. RIT-PI-f]KPG70358.1 hypothetical protein AEQ18_07225 [Enterococcus sp. RIT-PI-f]